MITVRCGVIIVSGKSKKSQPQPSKDSEQAPLRITTNVKQNLQFLKLWKEFQKRSSGTPKPATSYRRKKVDKEDLPEDIDLYKDPTLSLYYTNQDVESAVPVLLVDGYNVCGFWIKLKKHFMNGRLDTARQKLVDELVQFSMLLIWQFPKSYRSKGGGGFRCVDVWSTYPQRNVCWVCAADAKMVLRLRCQFLVVPYINCGKAWTSKSLKNEH